MVGPLILIVDDDLSIQGLLEKVLKREGYSILLGNDGEEAVKKYIEFNPDLVIMDIRLPGLNGMEAFQRIKSFDSEAMVILVTAYAAVEDAVKALKAGAYDYIIKPFHLDEIKLTVKRALQMRQLDSEVKSYRRQLTDGFQHIIGTGTRMQDIFQLIEKIADTNVTVLIRGESGTGKELIARAIHHLSSRRQQHFIAVNCAALPDNLVESELFGYEKGAFTGAISRKPGKFELANGGTLFLDEIGDMSLPLQAKLLRVIQAQEFERLGGTTPVKTDARVIAATNKNLEEAISRGSFREDLFYRLNVVPIVLPPLRERHEDIPHLAKFFMQKYSREFQRKVERISPEAMAIFGRYWWPGNIRELENVLKRAVLLTTSPEITPSCLPPALLRYEGDVCPKISSQPKLKEVLANVEKEMIARALVNSKGNRSEAARILGLSRRALIYKIQEYGLR